MSDPAADRLREWREQYVGRRTVPWQMLQAAGAVIETSARYHAYELTSAREAHARELETLKEAHAAEVSRLREWLETERKLRAAAEASEKAYRQQQTNLREQRETVDDGTVVRIAQPTFKSYGDREAARPWTLEELGTIEQRFRLAGGGDDTEVRFKSGHVEATVPFPELALPDRPSRPPAVPERDEQRPTPARRVPSRLATPAGVAVGVTLAVLMVLFGLLLR